MTLSDLVDTITTTVQTALPSGWTVRDTILPSEKLVTVGITGFSVRNVAMTGLKAEGTIAIDFYKSFDSGYLDHVEAVELVAQELSEAGLQALTLVDSVTSRVEAPTTVNDGNKVYRVIRLSFDFSEFLVGVV